MATLFPILSLALETRDQIYYDKEKKAQLAREESGSSVTDGYDHDHSIEDKSKENNHFRHHGRLGRGHIRARYSLPVQILRISHQVYEECTRVLFCNNWFRFDVNAEAAVAFLKALPKYQRNLIRHLVFGRDATGSDDDDAGRGLVKLLLDGGIDGLRVYFADEYSDPSDCPSNFRARYVEPVPVVREGYKLPAGVVLKNVNAIFEICHPKTDEEKRDALEKFRRK
ncbi:MAG: hypothetical protein L6R38_001628 [Xanthoria sp. 2 TBL-2021]|nr:MAG: hypothetical protein L6R38_001628 [Xanthoria sp. 2 TBL-2021]